MGNPTNHLASSSDIPDLDALADEFVAGDDDALARGLPADVLVPPDPTELRATNPRGVAVGVELQVSVAARPHPGAPTDGDEARDTCEAPAVGADAGEEFGVSLDEPSTNMYNPSVAAMLSRLTAPEVAAVEDPTQAKIRRVSKHIEDDIEALKAHGEKDDPRCAGVIKAAQDTLVEAAEVIDGLDADDDGLAAQRAELVQVYLVLKRAVAERVHDAEAEARAKAEADARARAAALEREAQAHKRGAQAAKVASRYGDSRLADLPANGRRNALLVITLMLVGGRIWLYAAERPRERVEQVQEGGAVKAINRAAGATADQLKRGTPGVIELALSQDARGNLRASVLAIDPDGDKVELTFKWIKNGKETVETGPSAMLPRARVVAGAAYRVQVDISDGKTKGKTITSGDLVARATLAVGAS